MSGMTQNPLVRIKDGAVRGRAEPGFSGIQAFLGIPYAAPPFGANRMQAPQPVQPWRGERDATSYGPTVPKAGYPPPYDRYYPEVVIDGEDCLNLNVWAPDPGAGGLPVLVWIHGGAFMNGSGSVGQYNGAAFARDGVVCVTINYRLSADGYLFLGDGIANLGLLDQLAALRWVQANIAAFGGDPARVTVAGESSGAMSVTTLLSMPLAEGLFSQAIAQSGAAAHTLTPDQGLLVSRHLAAGLGVPADRDAIRSVPLPTLVQAAAGLYAEVRMGRDRAKWGQLAPDALPFSPVVDGQILPQAPLPAIAAGQGRAVRLMIGSNRDEARIFLMAAGTLDLIDDAMLHGVCAAYGLSADSVDLYRANRPGASPGDVLAAVTTDWFYRIPAIRVAEARAGASPTWMYRFDRPEPQHNHRLGACHGAEMPFVFDTVAGEDIRPLLGDTPSQAVADVAHRAWVDFVTSADPGWAAYDTSRRSTGLLSEVLGAAADPAGDERARWQQIR